jgi:hypothetical protein
VNWRFGKMTRRVGIGHWHAHEGRHIAVSIMSSNLVPIQDVRDISDTVGYKSTHVTETVYRHVIVPEIRRGSDRDGRRLQRLSRRRRRRHRRGQRRSQERLGTWLGTYHSNVDPKNRWS